jgi:hypothetical protein
LHLLHGRRGSRQDVDQSVPGLDDQPAVPAGDPGRSTLRQLLVHVLGADGEFRPGSKKGTPSSAAVHSYLQFLKPRVIKDFKVQSIFSHLPSNLSLVASNNEPGVGFVLAGQTHLLRSDVVPVTELCAEIDGFCFHTQEANTTS